MPTKIDKMLANLEAEQLLDTKSQQEELIRAKDVAKRQASIEDQEVKSSEWRDTLERRREDMKGRWERIEARRRARIQYYHARIHHERSLNTSPVKSAGTERTEHTDP